MPKTSQNILILIQSETPKTEMLHTPVKIAKSYMNRFTIDEDASFELTGVHDVPLPPFQGNKLIPELFLERITRISRYTPIRNRRKSETHFIFAVNDERYLPSNLFYFDTIEIFQLLLSQFHVKSAMVSIISMARIHLITKEMMEAYPKRKKRS